MWVTGMQRGYDRIDAVIGHSTQLFEREGAVIFAGPEDFLYLSSQSLPRGIPFINMLHQSNDAELLRAIKEGDTGAFKVLYDRYWQRLYIKACQRVDKDAAKDMVQEVMTTLWRRRHDIFTFDDGEIGRYLFTAIKYRVISHYAYGTEEIRSMDLFDVPEASAADNPLETKEFSEFIESEIQRLPERMQQIFRMSREEDISITDIARQLNISEQTVKNQLTEALRRLRQSIRSQDNGDWAFVMFLLYYCCSAN
jgi:RNA polymerase sigma-70 factor (ECF subfamily)